ncbi:MAG: two component transcriptional regulator, winged helix family [Bacteroidetes bacterium]|nr:two component transcriptional regulator, winged helix family [Bacteroidota bacterium]
MKKILIIEDDVNLGTITGGVLNSLGYETKHLLSGIGVTNTIKEFKPDVVLLDVILNEKDDGFAIGKKIRSQYTIPIIFTTSCDANEDFDKGFSISNTDYLRKPYKIAELKNRIERFLQEIQLLPGFTLNKYAFIPQERSLKYDCDTINLNNLESSVLAILCAKPGVFISRSEIVEQVWHIEDTKLKDRSLNNVISSLRRHLKKDSLIKIDVRNRIGIRICIEKNNH